MAEKLPGINYSLTEDGQGVSRERDNGHDMIQYGNTLKNKTWIFQRRIGDLLNACEWIPWWDNVMALITGISPDYPDSY